MTKLIPLMMELIIILIKKLQKPYPPQPQSLGKISGNELRPLIREQLPKGNIHIGDYDLELTSVEEATRFLKWYHDKHPYTQDAYDCDKYAWVQRAEALKWMHGKFIWGYIEGSGLDPEYEFPEHGFNFIVDYNKQIYIADELAVAAPDDDFAPIYPIKATLIKA